MLELGPDGCDEALTGVARSSPESFDLVLALGLIEWLRWDRWGLQQIHRVLKDGGLLVLAAPDLYSLRSLLDPRYVAAKLAKRWLPAAPRSGARAPRTYASRRLRALLEGLGFEITSWSGLGTSGVHVLDRLDRWLPTHHLVVARRRSNASWMPPWMDDPALVRRSFEEEQRSDLALREVWRRRLEIPPGPPERLEPDRLSGARILVLSPHPDDEIIGCGGTLLRAVRAGAQVTVLQATDGSASAALDDAPQGVRRTVRLDEAQVVAEAAGFQPTIWWREDNGAFRYRDDLVAGLRQTLLEIRPTLIFTPFLADRHADHTTLNRIVASALETDVSNARIVCYEVWSLTPANLWCDVSACMGDVVRLLLSYETAMKVDDFVHMCSTRDHYHSLTLAGRPGYAEAFFATEPARFCELMRR